MGKHTVSLEHSPALTLFDQIRQLCVDFSDEWEQGKSPRIEDYLLRQPEEQRNVLLRNLLEIETEHRRRRGDEPSANEWIRRFPGYQAMICQLSLETCQFDVAGTHPSQDFSVVNTTPLNPRGVGPSAPARRLGHYRLIRELGRGGMGYVYEAVHLQRGERVALKTLPHVDGQRLHLFKREFRAIAQISHPNLVSPNALESDGEQWFFTMELLPNASTFLEWVRPHGALDEARLHDALRQLAGGVAMLHSAGIVHRDLKPTNVMVTADGIVKLLDFGLVKEIDENYTQTAGKVLGTPAYMAPEQGAAGAITPAADWYAVGVMLYESLTAKLPFSGSMVQVLMEKQTRDAPLEPLADENIPEPLAQLCQALLEREPGDRPDAERVFSVVGKPANEHSITASSRSVVGDQVRLLDRESHLSRLFERFEWVQATGLPSAVFVRGKSGEGKSALVDRFLSDLGQRHDFTLLSGRCYDREFVPFKALDSLIDALAGYLRSLESVEAAILLPDDAKLLADVFPVLGRVELIAKLPAPPTAKLEQAQVRNRAFAALRELLRRISLNSQVIMFSDDLQWGDADSAKVLTNVLGGADAPRILFIGSYRSDEAAGSPFLNAWERLQAESNSVVGPSDAASDADVLDVVEIDVAPLTVDHCVQLVTEVIGDSNRDKALRLGQELHDETGGNAFFLSELIELLDPESGALHRVPLHRVIANKLERLPEVSADLLDMIAVAGKAMDISELISVLEQDAGVYGTLGRMRNVRLVRTLGADSAILVDSYHDKIRETVLVRMPQQQKEALHLRLARWIEASDADICSKTIEAILAGREVEHPSHDRIYDLAAHFLRGGDDAKAAIYAFLAAEQAQRQFSAEVALQQFEISYSLYRSGELEQVGIRLLYGGCDLTGAPLRGGF
ncbi:MAG: protein kinase [Planctomycetales bacterium]|nr:protein kinase [Planctomycetales bacterium]